VSAVAAGGVRADPVVLVVDDHEATRNTVVDILTLAGFRARPAATAAEALAGQAASAPAVVVVDYRLPDATGLQLAARLKDADPDLPVIVLTGNVSFETAVAAVALVDEYLTKPVAPDVLLHAVRAAAERRRLVVENRQLVQQLQQANATLEAAVRERTLELQADRERLAEAQRIARLGSWEWDLRTKTLTASAELKRLLLLGDGDPPQRYEELFAHVLSEDLLFAEVHVHEAVERLGPFVFEVRVRLPDGGIRWLAVEGRIGVDESGAAARLIGTSQDITDRKRAEEELTHQALHDQLTGLPNRGLLLDRLDQALAQARRGGRMVAVLFLDLDRFKLVNDSRGHAAGDELLVAVAERLGAILRPLDTVARFGGDEFVMVCPVGAVDDVLHVHHLRHPGLLDHVQSMLAVSGLRPSSLCLELTESVLFDDVDRHMRTLLQLREIGVQLAIDDFGTGFSSLTYLKRFPVDIVKIDRSFVAGVSTDPSDAAIVRSVIDLAHALGLRVVAEGVEHAEQVEALRSLGCDTAQGFLFSPPRPADEIGDWLAGSRQWRARNETTGALRA